MRIWIVHGIHHQDSENWPYRMAATFAEEGVYGAEVFTYGYAYALFTRIQNPSRGKKLAARLKDGDVFVGHSNGADVIRRALEYNAVDRARVFLFQPALDYDSQINGDTTVIFNKRDVAVKVAKFFPAHPWGDMGAQGACFHPSIDSEMEPPYRCIPYSGHNAILREPITESWTRWMAGEIKRWSTQYMN